MKFEEFLEDFVPKLARKTRQLNKAYWILETTGLQDAADLKAELDSELKLLFHSQDTYQNLLRWEKELEDPLLKRQCNVLIRAFKQNQIAKSLLEQISQKEALLGQSYASFRPELEGQILSENDIREILKRENDPERRKKVWTASKQIGEVLAPQILEIVRLRNDSARFLGYPNYFEMQLELQEVDPDWLFKTLEELVEKSDASYSATLREIEERLKDRFQTEDLGPWAWSEPFCQEDPMDTHELDLLTEGVDIPKLGLDLYQRMGIDVKDVLLRSDMFERPNKNQHAFCMHVDRLGDIRTLNNVTSSIKWLETVFHELGHAIYEMGLHPDLPWLLKEPPHMIPTEAMALIAGRQAYLPHTLQELIGPGKEKLYEKAKLSLKRRQLIFSRWVMVMTLFERELYKNPDQDLNALWWDLVETYQKVRRPKGREKAFDWAAKYHIGLAPVYYFSYLLGEMFASKIQETLQNELKQESLLHPKVGVFLKEKLFSSGNSMRWDELAESVTRSPLSADAWVKEFAT